MDAGSLRTRSTRAFINCPEHPVQRVKRTDGVLELSVAFDAVSLQICIPLDDESPCTCISSQASDDIVIIEPKLTDSLGTPFPRPRQAGVTAVPERIRYVIPSNPELVRYITLYDDSPLPTKQAEPPAAGNLSPGVQLQQAALKYPHLTVPKTPA